MSLSKHMYNFFQHCSALTLIALAVALNVHSAFAASDGEKMAISLKIVNASVSGKIDVDLINHSRNRVRVWDDGNTWGAARWRLLILRKDELQTTFQNPDQRFTRNIPAFIEIEPGASRRYSLDLSDGTWVGARGTSANLQPGDRVIVIYDVPKHYPWNGAQITVKASNMNVWYGVVSDLAVVP